MKRKQRNANLNVNTAWSRGFRIPVYCGSSAIFLSLYHMAGIGKH